MIKQRRQLSDEHKKKLTRNFGNMTFFGGKQDNQKAYLRAARLEVMGRALHNKVR